MAISPDQNAFTSQTIPAGEESQRPEESVGIIDQEGNKFWVDRGSLTSAAPTSPLSDQQVERIRGFKRVLAEHDRTSFEEALTNFSRDRHPEGEIRLWELTARVYDAELSVRPAADVEERSLLYKAVLACALGARDVEAAIVFCPALDGLPGLDAVMGRFVDEATGWGGVSSETSIDSHVPSRPAGFEQVNIISPEAVDFATDFMGAYFDDRDKAHEMIDISRHNEEILLRGLFGLVDAVASAMMEHRPTKELIQELDYWADKDSGSGAYRIAVTLIANCVRLKVGDRWLRPQQSQETSVAPVLLANVESILAGILWSFIRGMPTKAGLDEEETLESLAESARGKATVTSPTHQAADETGDIWGEFPGGTAGAFGGLGPSSDFPDARTERPQTWAELEPNDAARRTVRLVVEYLQACRRGDFATMLELPGIHLGALMAGLVRCAGAIVPMFRETVGHNDAYLEVMDRFAVSEDGSDDVVRATVVQILNSRGGVEVSGRWTGPGTVEMSAAMVEEVCFGMAVTLNALINLTADLNDHDKDQAFRSFIRLLESEGS